jgi:hypothetical protein
MEVKMLKLSIKDIRIYWFTFLINLVFWSIMAIAAIQYPDVFLLLPVGFGLLIIMIPLGNDIRDGRDKLYASLPIKRSSILVAKYFSSFFLAAVSFIWIILLGLILEKYLPGLSGGISGSLSLESMLFLAFMITLIICIYLPFVLRFGFGALISGSLTITILVMAGFWLGSSYLISLNSEVPGIKTGGNNNLWSTLSGIDLFRNLAKIMEYHGRGISITIIILIMIIALMISIMISIKIFNKKEL